jgi:hypothetical protein
MNLSIDVKHLVRVKNEGSDDEVLREIMSLAGGHPSPEALERIRELSPDEKRSYLGQLIYNLAKEVPPYNVRGQKPSSSKR